MSIDKKSGCKFGIFKKNYSISVKKKGVRGHWAGYYNSPQRFLR